MVRDLFVLITGLTATALLAGCQPSEEKLIAESSATVKQYCVECHNYAEQVGGLSLERVDFADIGAHAAPARAAEILAGLGFSHTDQSRACSEFSGGWRMRVALASVLFSQPDLLLLDEPTNYLDLEATLWLEDHIARYPHTVIVISHDRDLLDTAVDWILHLEAGKLTLYRGGYKRGMVAMANSGRNTNGSQFFIMHQDYALQPQYVLFGKVESGIEVVDALASVETTGEVPVTKPIIRKVTIKP